MGKVKVSVDSITFSDQTKVDINPNDIVVIVGPNNSGKTTSLQDIESCLSGGDGTVITDVEIQKKGTKEDTIEWFENHFQKEKSGNNYRYRGMGANVWENHIPRDWGKNGQLGDISNAFCKYVETEGRLTSVKPVQNIDVLEDPHTHPLHTVFANKEIEERLSKSFKQAFGSPLLLNKWRGAKLGLQTCEKPDEKEWTSEFQKKLKNKPRLENQGDGMKSFVGCLLESTVTHHQIVLFDEPEAFLHPPQARLLGRMLARDKKENKQLFIATHSIDLLKGLIDTNTDNVRVIRIKRTENNINPTSELSPKNIEELWSDSLLRSSNILNGLFHEAVVLCEGDADSRFYSSIIDSVYDQDLENKKPDLMFTHCGGKSKMPIIISSLQEVDVPVITIADFDVLRNKHDIERIVNSLGGNFTQIQSEWKEIKNCFDQKAPPLSLNQVKEKIIDLLEAESSKYLSDQTAKEIKKQLKTVSAWSQAKESGKNALPSGQIRQSYQDLVKFLNKSGLFIVECGELEKFVPTVGNHGPKWLNDVLEKDLANDDELKQARDFIKDILSYLNYSFDEST